MEIEKISSSKHDFHEGCGPSETITLGLKCNNRVFILGKYYYGPWMADGTDVHAQETEEIIDFIVSHCNSHNKAPQFPK